MRYATALARLLDALTSSEKLDDELRAHLELEAEKLQRAGLERADAQRQARVAFGGLDRTKEESRDARGTVLLESVLQDARYAIRGLRAKPAFTVGIVMTLALGLGANAAMFGIVDRMLFRAPDYLRDPGLVHRVYMSASDDPDEHVWSYTSFPRYLDFVRRTRAFSSIATFAT